MLILLDHSRWITPQTNIPTPPYIWSFYYIQLFRRDYHQNQASIKNKCRVNGKLVTTKQFNTYITIRVSNLYCIINTYVILKWQP